MSNGCQSCCSGLGPATGLDQDAWKIRSCCVYDTLEQGRNADKGTIMFILLAPKPVHMDGQLGAIVLGRIFRFQERSAHSAVDPGFTAIQSNSRPICSAK
jgi:hypothetical protein